MRFVCKQCSCSFDIDEKSLKNVAEIACPQCQNLIQIKILHSDKLATEDPTTEDPTSTMKLTTLNATEFGELCLPKNKKISLSFSSESMQSMKRIVFEQPSIASGRKVGDVIIDDPSLSPRHASIEVYDDIYVIRDLNSKFGTFVNNNWIEMHRLKSTDEIRVGKVRLLFLVTDVDYHDDESGRSKPSKERSSRSGIQDVLESVFDEEETPSGVPDVLEIVYDDEERLSEEQQQRLTPEIPVSNQDDINFKETIQMKSVRPTQQPDVMVVIEFISGPNAQTNLTFKLETIILGRGTQADVTIEDEEVSRKHAAIEVTGSRTAYVKDLSSANGTYLNGDKISTSKLFDGDIIRIGSTELKVSFQS